MADYDMPELHIFSTFHKAKKYLQENHNPSQTNQFRFVIPAGLIDDTKAGNEIEGEEGKIIIPRWTRLECNDATYIEATISSEATMQDVAEFGLDALFMCYISNGQIESVEGNGMFIAFYNSIIRKIQMTNGGIYLSQCILNLSDTSTYLNNLFFIAIQDVAMLGEYPTVSIDENIAGFNIKGSNIHAYINSVAGSKIDLDNSLLTLVPIDDNPIVINCDITLESSKLSTDSNSQLNGSINGKNGFVMSGGTMDVNGEILNDISFNGGGILKLNNGSIVTLTEAECQFDLYIGSVLNLPFVRTIDVTLKPDSPILTGNIDLSILVNKGTPNQLSEVSVYNNTKSKFLSIIQIIGVVVTVVTIDPATIDIGDELMIFYK
ncbi:MAG: hypothetical protein PF448_06370 [Bacteroidales bacterium]|nr:hypothetical protein [Bacteroidales bacterium]